MEEKKKYSVMGTVTIGTDEYRDLLTEKFEAQKEASENNTRWYEQYNKARNLEDENTRLKNELEQLKRYIKDNDEQDKLELWIVRSSRED